MNSKTIEMSRERWSQVEDLFDRASQLENKEQKEFLKAACRGDDELHEYIRRLLRSTHALDETVEGAISETMSRVFVDEDAVADGMKGEMIGPYRVERLIGSGGMGMVYLAERADEQFDQQVAIKVGRHRLVDPDTVLRLRNERQILANLDHPNIARLFDGGTTDDGVPYLVMEYINGIRLDTYCDLHQLGVAERLKLFQTICGAVHYAHQNLVIHRDIKAANILVTVDGIPKLLDFGIAKLIDAAGEETDGLTREGAVIMTPANATPEQILGQPVTTATDTYALGLLLYLLLCGYKAYESDGLSPSEFARVVCQQDAVKPSLRFQQEQRLAVRTHDDSALPVINMASNDRSTSIARLQRRLRGDLDTIALNALRKEPLRRYRSVSALSDDIDLHLRSMPIVARSDSWRYRTGKFVRRHYAAVAASFLIVGMLATFSVVVSVQNKSITKERDTAREVSKFLEDIFMEQDPKIAKGAKITAEEILENGAKRIKSNLSDRPEIQSALMGIIGRVYHSLGEFQSSADLLEEALRLQRQTYGDNHLVVAAAKTHLAQTLVDQAEYSRAEELLESALVTYLKSGSSETVEIAENASNLANLLLLSGGDLGRAEELAEKSINLYEQLAEIPVVDRVTVPASGETIELKLAAAMATLARITQIQGDVEKTEQLLLDAIDIVIESEQQNHPWMVFYLQNLGVAQRTKGDLESARVTFDKAVAAARHIWGEKHDLLAAILIDQGIVFHLTGDFDNAERVMREALAQYRRTRGDSHPTVGFNLVVLGMLQHDMADLVAAEQTLRDAQSIFEAAYEGDHQYTASALTELGAVLNSANRTAEAETVLQRALAIRHKDYHEDHVMVAATRTEIADGLTRQGRFDDAEPLLVKSFDTLRDKPGRRTRRVTRALARFHELSGRSIPGVNP